MNVKILKKTQDYANIGNLPIIGRMAKDVISGYSGIITNVQFNIDGCIEIGITSDIQSTSISFTDGTYFDLSRVLLIGDDNVLDNCRGNLNNHFVFDVNKE